MSGIHCLVFSKDRAMQLDAFLRSADKYAPYESIAVLAQASDAVHRESYDDFPFNTIREWRWNTPFSQWVREWWEDKQPDHVVFHTDDDVFFRAPPDLTYISPVYSLRLGRNTTYCHPLDRMQQLPPQHSVTSWRQWKWRESDGDFGYPLSLNATIYRSADLLPLLDFHFSNPTELEAGLAARANRFKPEWMASPPRSCCVSLPHNVVSVSSGNPRGGNPDWQPAALCEKYLDGWRIDLDAMDWSNIVGAHQEVPLKFRRKDGEVMPNE